MQPNEQIPASDSTSDGKNNQEDAPMSRREILSMAASGLFGATLTAQEQEHRDSHSNTASQLEALKKSTLQIDEKKFQSLMTWQQQGFEKRFNDFDTFLRETNPAIFTALDRFNTLYACSVRCVGVRKQAGSEHEIVFMNTYERENIEPIRIAIPYRVLKETGNAENLVSLLTQDLEKQKKEESSIEKGNRTLASQYQLWKQDDSFDLPKGETTVLGVDYASGRVPIADVLLSVYNGTYDAHIERPIVTMASLWQSDLLNVNLADVDRIPKPLEREKFVSPTEMLTASLTNAVQKHDKAFVYHYIIHGKEIEGGKLDTHGGIPAEDIAKAIAQKYDGKPLCSLIDILIVADSCYSGMQLHGIIGYLKKEKIPVKNLRIVSAGNITPVAFTGQAMSVPSETVLNLQNEKMYYPVMSYYLSQYFQLVKHLESKGVRVPAHVGTMAHAIRHADRMARSDSLVGSLAGIVREQDLQYYHYSTESGTDGFLSINEKTGMDRRTG